MDTDLPFVTARRNFPTDTDGTTRIWLAGGYASDGITPLSSMERFCAGGGIAIANSNGNAYCNPYSYSHAHSNANCDSNSYAYTHSNANCDSNSYSIHPQLRQLPQQQLLTRPQQRQLRQQQLRIHPQLRQPELLALRRGLLQHRELDPHRRLARSAGNS